MSSSTDPVGRAVPLPTDQRRFLQACTAQLPKFADVRRCNVQLILRSEEPRVNREMQWRNGVVSIDGAVVERNAGHQALSSENVLVYGPSQVQVAYTVSGANLSTNFFERLCSQLESLLVNGYRCSGRSSVTLSGRFKKPTPEPEILTLCVSLAQNGGEVQLYASEPAVLNSLAEFMENGPPPQQPRPPEEQRSYFRGGW